MSWFGEIWNRGSRSIQWAGHVLARTATFGLVATGKVAKYGCKGTAWALDGLGADRIAKVVDNVGETTDHFLQAGSDGITAGVDIVISTPLAIGSFVIGEDQTADRLGDTIREDIDSYKDNAESMTDHATKAKDDFVGKTLFDEAHSQYLDLLDENKQKVSMLRDSRNKTKGKIDASVRQINEYKTESKQLFDRFVNIARKIADWNVARYDITDVFYCEAVSDIPLKAPSEVFADIDFKNDPVWSHIKGIFTAGLLTVSQVEDVKVKIAGYRRAATVAWMQDEELNAKYDKLKSSIEFVADTYDVFIPLYKDLLDELEYALSSIGQIMAERDIYFFSDVDSAVNPYFLPRRHLNVLMACDKLTRVICEMNKRHYVSVENDMPVVIKDDEDKVSSLKAREYREVEKLLAA